MVPGKKKKDNRTPTSNSCDEEPDLHFHTYNLELSQVYSQREIVYIHRSLLLDNETKKKYSAGQWSSEWNRILHIPGPSRPLEESDGRREIVAEALRTV